jgi:hypothetical protein
MAGFRTRLRKAWNVIRDKPESLGQYYTSPSYNSAYSQIWRSSASAVMAPIKTRIALDAAVVPIRHVDVDEFGRYVRTRPNSELNKRLSFKANIDQTGFVFIQDLVESMLDEGAVAIVPVDTNVDPVDTSSYEPLSLRTGFVVDWYNRAVNVSVYNEDTGRREDITLPKSYVAMCYSPLFSIVNQQNSTAKRLIDKLALLDYSDGRITSPKLDILIQLPFTIKSDVQRREADARIAALEAQLENSVYGIGYVDAAEKITQLNRPATNNLQEQVQYLQEQLHKELGLTPSVLDGTASEAEMLNYHNRTIYPILETICSAMTTTFLSDTAITQGQRVMAFPSIFKMAPLATIADAADKFTRNEILTSNDVRQLLGLHPVDDPDADTLRNKNLNKTGAEKEPAEPVNIKEEE